MKTRLEAYWREVIDRRVKDEGLSTSERYRQSIKRNRAVVMGLAAALAVLIALISVQFDKSWRDYNAAFGAHSATQNWLGGKLNSYSQDAYDMLLSIGRIETSYARYGTSRNTLAELSEQRRQVSTMLSHFEPGTLVGQGLAQYDSFAPAYKSAADLVAIAKEFELGRTPIDAVSKAAGQATDDWMRLKRDAVSQEFQIREGMQKTIVQFQGIASRTLTVVVCLWLVSVAAFIAALLATWRLMSIGRRRFVRFELLVASVGHDLRSPLQAIQSAASLLAGTISAADRAKYAGVVKVSTGTLARLVDDILQLALNEKLSIELRPVAIEAWFYNFVANYKDRAQAKGLEFSAVCAVDFSHIQMDPDRLAQCLGNLIDNAIKYTLAGRIDVSLSSTQRPSLGQKGKLIILVKDTGLGIAKEDQARVFKPFERASELAGTHGLGLGLSTAAVMTEALGGHIKLNSKPGVGTCFSIDFPVVIVDAASEAGESSPMADLAQETGGRVLRTEVLVVDDDAAIRASVAGILREAGLSVDTASSGSAALEKIQAQSYRVVLTDIQMPGCDGFELARHIRLVEQAPAIIAMTAHIASLNTDGRRNLFDGILAKPFSDADLLDQIDLGMDKTRA